MSGTSIIAQIFVPLNGRTIPAYCPRMCGHNRELHTESQA